MDFNNTKVAFSDKSDSELKMAKLLFQSIQNPSIIKVGKKLLNFAMSLNIPVSWLIRPTVFKHFCGGRTILESRKRMKLLEKSNIGTILDYSVESSNSEKDYDRNCKEIIETIKLAGTESGIPFAVFKITALGSNQILSSVGKNLPLNEADQVLWESIIVRVDQICSKAVAMKVPVLIDAEESWLQHAIDILAESMMLKYNQDRAWVYNTVQLYRNDKLGYLQELVIKGKEANFQVGLKLVRGAYMEKEHERAEEQGYNSPIFKEKLSTDQTFNAGVNFCINNLDWVYLVAGTHNEDSCMILADDMIRKNIAKDNPRIYFSQLLGMSDHISYNLAKEGFNVAKYVPYGPVKKVMPYLIRRAEENTSVAGQTSREMQLLNREIARRKALKGNRN